MSSISLRLLENDVLIGHECYPNGEPVVNLEKFPELKGFNLYHITWRYHPDEEVLSSFMTAMFLADSLAERGFTPGRLRIPCLPGARQDRLNSEGDFLFSAKSFAKEINARNFHAVEVFDPHSDVMPALIDRCEVTHVDEIFSWERYELQGHSWIGIIAPDAGAHKRAEKIASLLKLPVYQGWKTRDIANRSRITGFGLQDIPQGHYLVVDDLCDGGGTFMGLADAIAAQNCTADLWVTHGFFTKGTEELLARYRKVFSTNSTLWPKDGVEVVQVIREAELTP